VLNTARESYTTLWSNNERRKSIDTDITGFNESRWTIPTKDGLITTSIQASDTRARTRFRY